MENLENIIFIVEGIVSLVVIVGFIYSATKISKIKGFLVSSGILLLFLLLFSFIEWICHCQEIHPVLFYTFIILLSLFLLWCTVDGLIYNLTSGDEIKKIFIKDTLYKLKILGLSTIGAVLILELGMQIINHKSFILPFLAQIK